MECQKESSQEIEIELNKQQNRSCMMCQDRDDQQSVFLICRNCGIQVHRQCYYGKTIDQNEQLSQTNESWQCQKCDFSEKLKGQEFPEDTNCCFCTSSQGILKRVKIHYQSRWVHPTCVELIPEIQFIDDLKSMVTVINDKELTARRKVKCKYCKLEMALQCSHGKCLFSFHPHCAQYNKLLYKPQVMRYLFGTGLQNSDGQESYYLFCPTHILSRIEEGLIRRKAQDITLDESTTKDMYENFIEYWRAKSLAKSTQSSSLQLQRQQSDQKSPQIQTQNQAPVQNSTINVSQREKEEEAKKKRKPTDKYFHGDYIYQTPQKLRKTLSNEGIQQLGERIIESSISLRRTQSLNYQQMINSRLDLSKNPTSYTQSEQKEPKEGKEQGEPKEKKKRGRKPKSYHAELNQLQDQISYDVGVMPRLDTSHSESVKSSQSSMLNWDEEQIRNNVYQRQNSGPGNVAENEQNLQLDVQPHPRKIQQQRLLQQQEREISFRNKYRQDMNERRRQAEINDKIIQQNRRKLMELQKLKDQEDDEDEEDEEEEEEEDNNHPQQKDSSEDEDESDSNSSLEYSEDEEEEEQKNAQQAQKKVQSPIKEVSEESQNSQYSVDEEDCLLGESNSDYQYSESSQSSSSYISSQQHQLLSQQQQMLTGTSLIKEQKSNRKNSKIIQQLEMIERIENHSIVFMNIGQLDEYDMTKAINHVEPLPYNDNYQYETNNQMPLDYQNNQQINHNYEPPNESAKNVDYKEDEFLSIMD